MTQKIETPRARSTAGAPRSEATKAPATAAPVAALTPAQARSSTPEFQAEVKTAASLLQPSSPHVGKTAAPDALWSKGGGEAREVKEFRALSPEQKQARIAEVKAKRSQLEGKIEKREGELDKKWTYLLVVKKAETLREFTQPGNTTLKPEVKAELTKIMAKSAEITAKIEDAKRRAAEMGPASQTKASPEERAALAKEIRQLRRENSSTVKKGTELVDAQGLKLDRLANAEATLDPNVAPENSLWGMIGAWFQLTTMSSNFDDVMVATFQNAARRESEMGRENAERIQKDEGKKRVLGKAVEARRQTVGEQLAELMARLDGVPGPRASRR